MVEHTDAFGFSFPAVLTRILVFLNRQLYGAYKYGLLSAIKKMN
jgi:hypothetical protein